MFAVLIPFLLPCTPLLADPGRQPAPPAQASGARPDRAHIAARLHEIRTQRLQCSLGVTEALAKSIADRWGQFDQESHERRRAMRQARQSVQEILLGPGSEEEKSARIAIPMGQFATLQRQQKEGKQRFEEEIQRMLTPVQQGRFILLLDAFQRDMILALPENRRREGF